MGTPSLNKLVCRKCSIKVKALGSASSELVIIAVDMSIYLHLFIKKSKDMPEFILNIIRFIIKLKELNVEPIIVLDGKSRKEKEGTLKKRRNQRYNAMKRADTLQLQLDKIQTRIDQTENDSSSESDSDDEEFINDLKNVKTTITDQIEKLMKKCTTIKRDHINTLKETLTMLGIVFIHSTEEADPLCAALVKSGIAKGCLSNDNDMLVYGCPETYQNFIFYNNSVSVYNLENILEELELNYDEFVDMCILMGTDYSKPLTGMKPEIALECIRRYGNIENVLQNLDNINNTIIRQYRMKFANVKYLRYPEKDKFDYKAVRKIIKTTPNVTDYIQHTNFKELTQEWLYGSHRLIQLEKFLIETVEMNPDDARQKVRYINLIWSSVIKKRNGKYQQTDLSGHPISKYDNYLFKTSIT